MATVAVEAVKVELPTYSNPVTRTVASGTQISGGNLLILSDPNTVTKSVGATDGDAFGGIAAAEKSIDDGDVSTSLSCRMDGKYDITCASAVTAGEAVSMSGANQIKTATAAELLSGGLVGYTEETGTAAEVVTVRLRGL